MNAYGRGDDGRGDDHEQDVVMPGFRFHPTEEELVEFYLRRKVEGRRFNVDLIPYLDLYRYDPWELPAFATIGEKEWFFYVPRDRKYRNGDRPNRVTTSGYWKATGADRMIRAEGGRPIGLKKTLVFYSGKAPKGVRTGWIMNEYRLPHNDTDRLQKAEISLCRVYKRPGMEDRYHLPGALSSKPSSSRGTTASSKKQSATHQPLHNMQSLTGHSCSSSNMEKIREYSASGVTNGGAVAVPSLPKLESFGTPEAAAAPLSSTTTEEDVAPLQHSKGCMGHDHAPTCRLLMSTSFSSSMPAATVDELNRIAAYHQSYGTQTSHQLFPLLSQPQLPLTSLPISQLTALATDKLWEWNPISEPEINFTNFK